MKEERRLKFRAYLLVTLLLIIVGTFSCIVIKKHYEYELNLYSVEKYQLLNQIANDVIKSDVGIDLSAVPDDVSKYEIINESNVTTFTYYLDKDKDMLFANSAYMSLILSKDFKIISKDSNYSAKEKYIKSIKTNMFFFSIVIAFFVSLAFAIIIDIINHVVLYIFLLKYSKKASCCKYTLNI